MSTRNASGNREFPSASDFRRSGAALSSRDDVDDLPRHGIDDQNVARQLGVVILLENRDLIDERPRQRMQRQLLLRWKSKIAQGKNSS